MPKDDTQNNNPTTPFMAPDDVLPPMPIVTSNSSAAPINDVVKDTIMPDITTTTPKKKFAGGKIIATILGLFLLVGGVGAGVFLTSQNQNPNEEAGPNDPEERSCTDTGCTPDATSGFFNCSGVTYARCGGCVNTCVRSDLLVPGGCEAYVNKKCGTGGVGNCNAVDAPVEIFYCKGGVPGGQACNKKDELPAGVGWDNTNKRIIGKYCGTIQVDEAGQNNSDTVFCRGDSTAGCATTPPNPPAITASCSGVKAYSTNNWTLLTASALSGLRSGYDSVYFCVNGTTSGGSFDRAKFTINGTVQAETTTKRPNSNDFCQLYNLPTGVNSYNVTAQIHHASLGWK